MGMSNYVDNNMDLDQNGSKLKPKNDILHI